VEKDKSMTAMIQNDAEKEWMMPLLDLRNALDFRSHSTAEEPMNSDQHLRDFRRMSGATQLMGNNDRFIPGPYHQQAREDWLTKLLEAQVWIRKNGPKDVREIELITHEELQEIRRLWVVDKHELEDRLPGIYRKVTGEEYPGRPLDDQSLLGAEQMEVLAALCGEDRLHYEMARELLSVTMQQQASARRSGLHDKLEKSIKRHFFDDKEDAFARAKRRAEKLDSTSTPEGGVA
jgi:DNA sulfur modification protein DndC